MSFLDQIVSIFFDPEISPRVLADPRDLTHHYRWEIPNLSLDRVYIGSEYRHISERVDRYKYHSDRTQTIELITILSSISTIANIENISEYMVVPIPMHWSRYLIRGFHHTDRLAREFARVNDIEYSPLLATIWTRRQSQLSKKQRQKNREWVFALRKKSSIPSKVILIDDIISTGSTANSAAQVLKKAWVKEVIGFFIASNQ
jgi:ComF family protein